MTDNILPPDDGNGAAIPPDVPVNNQPPDNPDPVPDDDLGPRLERLGGEPAPDITPEEFARLQQAGQIHIDPRGRVRKPSGMRPMPASRCASGERGIPVMSPIDLDRCARRWRWMASTRPMPSARWLQPRALRRSDNRAGSPRQASV